MIAATRKYPAVALEKLLTGFADGPVPSCEVSDLSLSAQHAQPGGLFLATAGSTRHGLTFLDQALARGVAAVAWEPGPAVTTPALPADVVAVPVPDLRQQVGFIADRFFAAPSSQIRIAGITGTNGKTSSAYFAAQAVEQLGPDCGFIGTLGSGRPGALRGSELTTPDAVEVQRTLADMRASGIGYLAMEVSSHALVQGRINGMQLDCAAFTNLSRDHLDYHGDMDAYGAAKRDLFTRHNPRRAVINLADPVGSEMQAGLPAKTPCIQVNPVQTPAAGEEFLRATQFDATDTGMTFQVEGSFGAARLHSRLVGEFNASNLLVALGILLSWGFSFRRSVAALECVSAPAGRMETFKAANGPLVIVDYAHTPDALEKVLLAARAHARGKLALVFGCGGDRDVGKRPEMGAIASRLADRVVVTDDNPRNEDPDQIVAQIVAGMTTPATKERDRAAAIALAIEALGDGDVLVVAGKGHELYQTTAAGRQPFSDSQVVRDLLHIEREAAGGVA